MSRFLLVVTAALSFSIAFSEASGEHLIRHVTLPRRASDFATIPTAQFSVPISGKVARRQAKKNLIKLLRPSAGGKTAVVAGSDFDEEYLVNATIGGQNFAMILDTGSSDTWVAQTGFTCIDLASVEQPEAECAFGPLFEPSASGTFKSLPDLNFNITYGDGEFLLGTAANETVNIGGLVVPQQEIGVVSRAAWFGDTFNSGLIGLAYPMLTSVYAGTDPTVDDFLVNNVFYNSFFFSAVRDNLVSSPFFSIALNRGTFKQELNDPFTPNLGFLSFGGMAPVPITHVSTTAPVQGYSITDLTPSNSSIAGHFFYTVDVQRISFPGSQQFNSFNNNTILDTGTTLNYVPTEIADAFAASTSPPAVWSDDLGAYIISCRARVPTFEVTIHGTTFSVDGRDNILPIGTDDDGNVVCIMGTSDGGPNVDGNLFILGDTFLHNVVATFNVESNEITITQRQRY